ncbi:glycosyltransferase [Herbaspirillum sp. WKF16]|uniref:glycosyltransferase n=1 Tax=Herbaspirillum sp. WKF16 TaxID=3028312 RepID=UPI0023A9A12B|nr:glycosyltransferase [Herbaspirillum sp. WKF16]WDZ96603.1 glycosyltransferase [Herbaspirillum sp. WKF16]
MKVLHCPEIVGGNAQQLAKAEREVGLDSTAVALRGSSFGYKSDKMLLSKPVGRLRLELAKWELFFRAFSFDVVHFNFGQAIMPAPRPIDRVEFNWLQRRLIQAYFRVFELLDVKLLKACGKVTVMTYQGDDARQGDYCRENFPITFANEVDQAYYSPESDRLKRVRIAKYAKYVDRIFSLNPDLLHVLPEHAQFLPYCHIDLREWSVVERTPAEQNVRPVVLHAPSHRGVKGTRFILDAVSRLQEEGIDFEFVMVEGMRQDEARRLYERADILVDQLLAGWYGGIAVELMALGKPVIAYIREADLKFVPEEMRAQLPVVQAEPETIYEVLKRCLTTDRGLLPEMGMRSRRFVERWHDPHQIAVRMLETYKNCVREKNNGSGQIG